LAIAEYAGKMLDQDVGAELLRITPSEFALVIIHLYLSQTTLELSNSSTKTLASAVESLFFTQQMVPRRSFQKSKVISLLKH